MASTPLTFWQNPAQHIELKPKSVHLWRFRLDAVSLPDLLDCGEKLRAQRLRRPEKARAFVVARTRLRQILSAYLEASPASLEFKTNAHGKPALAGVYSGRFSFNLSHSGVWGLCGVAREGSLGVDLEAIDSELNFAPLAARFFSKAEAAWCLTGSRARQRRNFYRLWTRKEAWLKGKGGGFSEPGLELEPAHIGSLSVAANGWFVMNLPIARGYLGALAVSGEVEAVERYMLE